MALSDTLFSVETRHNQDAGYSTAVVTLAPPGLRKKPTEESGEAFENRRSRFFAIMAERTETLRTLSQRTALIPQLITAPIRGSGLAQFTQAVDENDPPLAEDQQRLLLIAADLAEGLAVVHAHEQVHLGIFPATLRFGPTRTTVCGIGADLRETAPENHTFADLGDPRFSPPELFDKSLRAQVGPWSDIYQLSATVYCLAVGAPPPSFPERITDKAGTSERIRTALDESSHLDGTGLGDAVAAGLELSRFDRPQDASQWAAMINFARALQRSDGGGEAEPSALDLEGLRAAQAVTKAREEAEAQAKAKAQAQVEAEAKAQADAKAAAAAAAAAEAEAVYAKAEPEEEIQAFEETERKKSGSKWLAFLVVGGLVSSGLAFGYSEGLFDASPQIEQPASVDPVDVEPSPTPTAPPPPEEPPEPALPQLDWLLGSWVIDQELTGCTRRLVIEKGDDPQTLVFTNPLTDQSQDDTFTQTEPDSLTTSNWSYSLSGNVIRMVSTSDSSLTASLSKCVVEQGEGGAAQ